MVDNQNDQPKRWHVGTIEGASFLMGIVLLIVVFYHVLPGLARFHDYITNDTQKLQESIAELKVETDKLKLQICSTNFDREVRELNAAVFMLNELGVKGSTAVQDQAKTTSKAIADLVKLLQTEIPEQPAEE